MNAEIRTPYNTAFSFLLHWYGYINVAGAGTRAPPYLFLKPGETKQFECTYSIILAWCIVSRRADRCHPRCRLAFTPIKQLSRWRNGPTFQSRLQVQRYFMQTESTASVYGNSLNNCTATPNQRRFNIGTRKIVTEVFDDAR